MLKVIEKFNFFRMIHLVSKVTGHLHENATTMQVVADTFPAGTLSGALSTEQCN
jgi:anthranilate/para-aminobenzoate synthase component I